MKGDEIELTKEELQKWIRKKVKKNELLASDVLEKCHLLQSLLERREKQAALLLRLCESVSACEEIVKKQYSLLGWEYRDTDSDDDDNMTGCENTGSPTTNCPTPPSPKLQDSGNLKKNSIGLKRELVVVLNRLSTTKLRSLCRQKRKNYNIDYELSDSLDSDWEPEGDSSDSDFSVTSEKIGPNKRRKTHQKDKEKSYATPEASPTTSDKSNVMETSTPPANTNATVRPVCIAAVCQAPDKATKTPPDVPQEELKVNMTVVARSRAMKWQQGKITEILTKEDGRLKYKVYFEDKGKSLVSGHHIAFDYKPKVDQLFIGARVLVKSKPDLCQFFPGVLGEFPTRRNHMRFLVFTDDHTPIYVGLPYLRLVCRPLANPLDDIPDGVHKNFLKGYLDAWPYPPQTQYKVGQIVNIELNGVMQRCKVKMVDSSLMQVVVLTDDQQKMWIYRGSTCLEQMFHLREPLELEKDERQGTKSKS